MTTVEGILVVEGSSRAEWRKETPAEWRLDRIWPSRRERFRLNRAIRLGRPTLVIENTPGEPVDVLDEEIAAPRQIDRYVVHRESGITTLYVPAFDWLPRPVRAEAASFIERHEQLARVIGRNAGPMMTPPLAKRHNLRLLYLPREKSSVLTDERLSALAHLAFPRPCNSRKAHP